MEETTPWMNPHHTWEKSELEPSKLMESSMNHLVSWEGSLRELFSDLGFWFGDYEGFGVWVVEIGLFY